ncbi:MAG TPA: hypothetical protein VMF08_06695, partial [Candidatus Sulfotelmatobacter sp.]|nr:hypothetical protein [Candidatus Sulfotelmatobacter sp.]
ALVIVAENLRALLRRVMGTITGRIFHTLTLTELPQPCLAGVSNTDTVHRHHCSEHRIGPVQTIHPAPFTAVPSDAEFVV